MKLSKKQAQEAVDALTRAIDAGYPLGKGGVPPGELGAYRAAADELGLSVRTIRDRVSTAKAKGITIPDDSEALEAQQIHKTQQNKLRLEEENKTLKQQLSDIHKANIEATQIKEWIVGIQTSLPKPPEWIIESSKKGGPGVPVTLWADWHLGEVVNPDQVAGLNAFNIDIAQKRVKRLVEKIIHLSFDYSNEPNYPGIVAALGGDIVSGNLHDLGETNDATLAEQVISAFRIIAPAITALADSFGAVFCPCVTGNHGRLSIKPKIKNRVQDNVEWLLYHFLDEYFKDDSRVTLLIPDHTDALFSVAGHRFLLQHGDSTGARGGDGIVGAIGPIVRGEKKVRDTQAMVQETYDTMLMGHWHQTVFLDGVIVSPALKGYCEFARNAMRARPERPAQWLFYVHTDQGINDAKRIYLEDKPSRGNVNWVSWPKE